MFSSHERLKERTGKYGTPRLEYLQSLVTEFQGTTNEESKERIVAHLANFAYDPINFEFLRQLNVLELFIDCLTEPNERLVEFGMGGLCNAAADPENAKVIVECEGIPEVISCLSSEVESTVLSAMACLYYLCDASTREKILTPPVVDCIQRYAAAETVNVKFSRMAMAFLRKHVGHSPR